MLRADPTNTPLMWLGSGQLVRQVSIGDVPVFSTHVKPVESARDLDGVVIDRQLSQLKPPHSVAVMATISLDNVSSCSVSDSGCREDVQAFITCRLDYCNSLLYGVSNQQKI